MKIYFIINIIIYVNNIHKGISILHAVIYADNTILTANLEKKETVKKINLEIKKINICLKANRLTLNINK